MHRGLVAVQLNQQDGRYRDDVVECRGVTQRALSSYIVQSRVSFVGIASMVWLSTPHVGTWDPLGQETG